MPKKNPLSLDTSKLFITRKRKKWKFAHFDTYENCFSFADMGIDELQVEVKGYLPKTQPLTLELAAGNAQFSLELARRYPKQNFIAIDIKSDRLYTSAKQALEEKVGNIAFVRLPLDKIGEAFSGKSVDTIWLTFPDPYPRKRSAKHRLTHPSYLQHYRKILKSNAEMYFKTDNRELFLWSLEQLVADKWQISELSFDLHESNLPDDYKIKTAYETRFLKDLIPINFGTFLILE